MARAQQSASWVRRSWAYQKAQQLVDQTLGQQGGLLSLITKVGLLNSKNLGSLRELKGSLQATLRLLRSYAAGDYRDISKQSLALIVTSLIYLVMPFDAVPDFILALGFADDAALLAWTLRAVHADIQRFQQWEVDQSAAQSAQSTNF